MKGRREIKKEEKKEGKEGGKKGGKENGRGEVLRTSTEKHMRES